jgi:hypothetical protein
MVAVRTALVRQTNRQGSRRARRDTKCVPGTVVDRAIPVGPSPRSSPPLFAARRGRGDRCRSYSSRDP